MRPLDAVGNVVPLPRQLAARALWHDLGALLSGRPPRHVSLDDARRRRDLDEAAALLDRGDVDGAIRITDAILADRPSSVSALRLRLAAEQAAGRTAAALGIVQAIRRRADAPSLAELERRLAGTILLEDTAWVPELPARPPCRDPGGPTIVVLPPARALAAADRAWVGHVLRAASEAGLRPVAIPPPGGDADDADGDWSSLGTGWHALAFGPAYPADPPPDRAALDHAWGAAAAAPAIRPSRVLVPVAGRDEHTLAVGLALRSAVGLPLVAVVADDRTDGAGEAASPRLGRADSVIVAGLASDASLADRLRAAAVAPGPAGVG